MKLNKENIFIRLDDDEINNSYVNSIYVQNSNNKNEEKVEIFSLSSTPERKPKPKIRKRIRQKTKKGIKANKLNIKKNKYKIQIKYIDIFENSKNESENTINRKNIIYRNRHNANFKE